MRSELGRYRLIRHLATGGMGEVYLSEAVGAAGFAKRLVIKTLRAELAEDQRLVDQFVAEGRLLEVLDHPNIAQIIDLGRVDGTYFLAMEHVAGFDLRALRRALPAPTGQGRLAEGAVVSIIVAVAEALYHAQTRVDDNGKPLRIVHHDVTPSNIMVRRDGHLKLVDFGIARSAIRARLKQESLRGKLPYLSPEQASMGRVDGRADVFSLGIVACEMLSGTRPLDVADPAGLPSAHAQLAARVAALADLGVHHDTVSLLQDMVALDPAARCRSARVVATRARSRLLALGQSSIELLLADALKPAFDALELQAGGFDATLSSLLGPGADFGDGTGTFSLPGVELGQAVDGEGAPQLLVGGGTERTGPPLVPLRKRVIFGAFVVVALATVGGWWLGSRGATTAPPLAVENPAAAAAVALRATTAADASTSGPSAAGITAEPSAEVDAGNLDAGNADAGNPDISEPDVGQTPDTTADVPATDATSPPPRARTVKAARRPGTLVFFVQPADALVTVDGRAVKGDKRGLYRIRAAAGRHRILARDTVSGRTKRRTVELQAGQEKKLQGFVVATMP